MKKILLLLLMLLALVSVFAVDFETAFSQALENSPDVKTFTKESELKLLKQSVSDLDDGISVNVSVKPVTVTEGTLYLPNSTLTVTLPELAEDLKLSAGLSTGNIEKGKAFSVSPSLSLSKKFTFKNYEDNRTDLMEEKSNLSDEVYYDSKYYQFKTGFINSVTQIMNSELSLSQTERRLESSEKNLASSIAAGSIDSGSLKEIKQQKEIDSAKLSLEISKRTMKSTLATFEKNYGFAYETITEVPEADLTFEPDSNKSLTVRKAQIDVETAKQALAAKLGLSQTLSLSADASVDLGFDKEHAYSQAKLSTNVSASYQVNNLSLTASFTGTAAGDEYKPSLTLSGSWKNNAAPDEKEKLEILELENALETAEQSLENAIWNYEKNAASLSSQIEKWFEDERLEEIDRQYNLAVLEYQTELYSKGYISETELKDAQLAVQEDEVNKLIHRLEALSLENQIKTFNN